MLVYGDSREDVAPAEYLAALARDDGRWLAHDALRNRFIALAGLTQGVADGDFDEAGQDRPRAAENALLASLKTHGAALMASWDADCSGAVAPPLPPSAGLPQQVQVKQAEGYAFYALYPEAYGLAARTLRLSAPARVIGLRSIGGGLAAIAAAALDAPIPITLRPGGDPFARSLRIDDELAHRLLDGDAHYVIVDEGPGLSGSSFGAVADWLEDHGVAPDRIAFLPGHGGELGPQASERHRARWAGTQRPVVAIDRLRAWIEAVVGPASRWDDLSSGAWRTLWSAAEQDWPPVVPAWERAKFRLRTEGGDWVARFAGLGDLGGRKLQLARLLHETGFGPEVAGLKYGWLIQRWHESARPTLPTGDELLAYLKLRADLPAASGASLRDLVTMARRNVPALAQWEPQLDRLAPLVRPVQIDGKLEAHEWLRLEDGRLLKADALDHHCAHDLIGAQDVGWEIAGAAIELGLKPAEVGKLERELGADPALSAFYRVAYLAFRIGAHGLGEEMSPAEEAPRHQRALRRYESALVDAVEQLRDVDQSLALGIEALA